MAQPLTWGHTPIPEMDFGLITQESPAFRHGECQYVGVVYSADSARATTCAHGHKHHYQQENR